MNPKHAKFDQKPEIGHVRTCPGGPIRAHMGPNPDWAVTDVWFAARSVVVVHGQMFFQMLEYFLSHIFNMNRNALHSSIWSGLGPIWALMFFVKNVTFRVQTAPFDKITIDFWRSRRRLYIPDLLKAKNSNARLSFFKGVVFSSKVLRFGSRRLRLTK